MFVSEWVYNLLVVMGGGEVWGFGGLGFDKMT